MRALPTPLATLIFVKSDHYFRIRLAIHLKDEQGKVGMPQYANQDHCTDRTLILVGRAKEKVCTEFSRVARNFFGTGDDSMIESCFIEGFLRDGALAMTFQASHEAVLD